jgi:uncharacterized protein (TIGR01244 family)
VPQYKQIDSTLFIGPQPTRPDLEQARQQGIRTVIDFRLPTETTSPNADLARDAGLDYVNIPVNRTTLSSAQVGDFETAMERHPGPYLVHCATGARAALMVALARAREHGWTAERTLEAAEAMGFNLRNSPEFVDFVRQSTGA